MTRTRTILLALAVSAIAVNVLAAPSAVEEADLPGGGGEVLGGAEKITLQQAFDLFTVKAAEQMGDRYRTGLIQKGLLADVVVLDRNPYKVPVTDIHNIKVKLTLINGEVVYRAGQPAN
jgi:predicted amidohydrolase YtcJ